LLINHEDKRIPINRQAEMLGVARSTIYHKPKVNSYNSELIDLIDEQYTKTPFYGSRRMTEALKRKDYQVNRKRIQRLMRLIGIETIYPKPNLSKPHPGHKIYPYSLKNLKINSVNQVWGTDITYMRLKHGRQR